MKFLCVSCDESMKLEKTGGPDEGSMSITFCCPKCKNKIAMFTNPQETQLVKSLDVCIGASSGSSKPLSAVRDGLANQKSDEDKIMWTNEAEKRLGKVPSFVRQMARIGVINFAKDNGIKEITPEVMEQAREKMGM